MAERHAGAQAGPRAFHIDRDGRRYAATDEGRAEIAVAAHLLRHVEDAEAEPPRLGGDDPRILLDGIRVDDVAIGRDLSRLMEADGGFDQPRVAAPQNVQELAPPFVPRCGLNLKD
jgi:hypothetical protein